MTISQSKLYFATALSTGLLSLAAPLCSAAIPANVSVHGEIFLDTSFSTSGAASVHSGVLSSTAGGSPYNTNFANGTPTGINPLINPLYRAGDNLAIQNVSSTCAADSHTQVGIDGLLVITNKSTQVYEAIFILQYTNTVNASGIDAFAHSELTVDGPSGEIFFTDIESDTIEGDNKNGLALGSLGSTLSDTGARILTISLPPASVVVLNIEWTLQMEALTSSSAVGYFGASIALARVQAPSQSPVLHWNIEENIGTNTAELISGATNIAHLAGTASWGGGIARDGTAAAALDGSTGTYIDAGTMKADSSYVAGSNPDYRVLAQNYTITSWIHLERQQNNADRTIISSDWNSADGWMLFIRNINGKNNLGFDFGNQPITSDIHLMTDRPYFVALQVDGSGGSFSGSNKYRFAVWDGATWHFSEGAVATDIRLQGMEIGSYNNGQRPFEGLIDDTRIYGTTLTQFDLDLLTLADSDSDGFPDAADDDDDNDGLADSFEQYLGSNTKKQDSDDDGHDDRQESIAGTNPLDEDSLLLLKISNQGSDLILSWDSVEDRVYSIQATTNFISGAETTISSNLPATPPTNSRLVTPSPGNTAIFYLQVQEIPQ